MTSPPAPQQPPGKDEVSPWQETVRLSPVPSGPHPSETPLPDEVAAAPVTAKFGKFIRTRRLGAGGMGEVWKAWDTVLGRWVALKFLKGGDDEEIARFQREAQTAGRLHHPNIAAIYDVSEDQGRRYIAMQFVDGQNLHDFPRDDRRLLVRLIADAARALQYAHEQGVIHRDLKPENLMVTRRGGEHHVFLMDFGLARIAEGASKLSATGFLVGTPMYMSPEQARGDKVDVTSDVYSLGLTLYELLTGARPFTSENVYETLRRVQELDPPAPRELDRKIHEDLETVVLKAISKDPPARYPTAKAFADDLQAYLAGEPIQGRRESLSRKLMRRVRRHPVAFAATLVLAVGLAASGTFARGAFRDRRVTGLTAKVEQGLRTRDWTPERLAEVERWIADLAALAPAEGADAKGRLSRALAESVRSSDLTRARAHLELLERLDPSEAGRLAAELRQREAVWPSVIKLEPPLSGLESVFEPGQVRAQGELIRAAAGGPILSRKLCEGNVELKAEYASGWKEASHLGLLLNASRSSGYRFLLLTAEGESPPSFGAAGAAQGTFRLQIRRGDQLLREEIVPAGRLSLDAPLRFLARREGDRLTLQANDLPPVEFRDPFALGVGQKGVFGIVCPAQAGIRRLLASHQDLPPAPSPLDVGDALFVQDRFEEALDRYGEAAQSAAAEAVRPEALYKQGLCLLQLNREEAARKAFEGVAAGFLAAAPGTDTRWPFLADCQLLMIFFRDRQGIERASAVLDKLGTYGYSFDKLALLLPPDLQRQVLSNAEIGSIGANLHLKPEEHVARTEFSLRASELLEPPSARGEWRYHHLMRAYMMVGRDADAFRTAEKSFRLYGPTGEILDDYSWILRLQGKAEDALRVIEPGLSDRIRRVERARIYAALRQWEKAAADLDAVLSAPADYTATSAACLARGFVLEQLGAGPERVQEAWRQGLLKYWKPGRADQANVQTAQGLSTMGMAMLHDWMMASMTGDMTDADAELLLSGLIGFAGKDNPVFNKLMRPSMLRAAWRTPRARNLARRIALREVPFADTVRFPLFLGWIAFLQEVCWKPEEGMSTGEEELLWRMSSEIYAAYREGKLNERYFLPFGSIMMGNPNAPGMGWREIALMLKDAPRLRGPLAYLCGRRYLKKDDPKTALMFFRSARADCDRDPSLDLLRTLADLEIDALAPK